MHILNRENIISINKGDDISWPIFINVGNKFFPIRYILEDNDELLVSLMEPNQAFECGVVRKVLTKDNLNCIGDAVLELSSKDTENLLKGTYYLEAKLKTTKKGKDYYKTVMQKKKFVLI